MLLSVDLFSELFGGTTWVDMTYDMSTIERVGPSSGGVAIRIVLPVLWITSCLNVMAGRRNE